MRKSWRRSHVGCVLSWGRVVLQKQFLKESEQAFVARLPDAVRRRSLRLPSSHAGHLCLLRLKERRLPRHERRRRCRVGICRFSNGAKNRGALSASPQRLGFKVNAKSLPTFDMPPFDGIGANEFIVDTVPRRLRFISAVDTPFVWELKHLVHTLNCGMTTRISGETDFPCIYGETRRAGRAYVKLTKDSPVDYDRWADGIRDGRSYCSEGLAHLFDFAITPMAASLGRR